MILFEKPLIEAEFLCRYKRFFANLVLPNGEKVTAHVPNTGSMKGLIDQPTSALLTHNSDPNRKLSYTLEALKVDGQWVGVNTSRPSQLAAELFKQNKHPLWSLHSDYFQEIKINDETRLDGLVAPQGLFSKKPIGQKIFEIHKARQSKQPLHFFELKNVTLKHNGVAMFPDSKSERAVKHIVELEKLLNEGHSGEILFIIQRTDCKGFQPADHIHSEYGLVLRRAAKAGLKVTTAQFEFSNKGIQLSQFEILSAQNLI